MNPRSSSFASLHPTLHRALRPADWLAMGLLIPLLAGCSVLSRLDYSHILSRQGWQRSDRVIETLELQPGDRVADLGSGDGYFSFPLADAVGPGGRVYAVDIDEEKIRALRLEVAERGYRNIEVILAEPDDPGLPDGGIDLVFLCNAYHHFGERVAYFTRLQRDLAPGARLAVVDGKSEGAATFFLPDGHWLPPGELVAELEVAGYRHTNAYNFLPLQSFDLFSAGLDEHGEQ
jgi:ubiquinone/menaquinone biosynthesis C-methylase UbiE